MKKEEIPRYFDLFTTKEVNPEKVVSFFILYFKTWPSSHTALLCALQYTDSLTLTLIEFVAGFAGTKKKRGGGECKKKKPNNQPRKERKKKNVDLNLVCVSYRMTESL